MFFGHFTDVPQKRDNKWCSSQLEDRIKSSSDQGFCVIARQCGKFTVDSCLRTLFESFCRKFSEKHRWRQAWANKLRCECPSLRRLRFTFSRWLQLEKCKQNLAQMDKKLRKNRKCSNCVQRVSKRRNYVYDCRLRPARERCEKSPRWEKKTTRLRQKRKSASRIYAFSRRKKKRENFLTHSWETTQRLLLLAKVN